METLNTFFVIIVLCTWLLALIESIAMWLFVPFVFRIGIKVKSVEGVDINLDRFQIGRAYETAHAKFIRISKNSSVFSYRDSFFQHHTLFPVKGEILQRESGLFLIWRVPLGTSIFLALCFMTGLISGILSLFRLDITEGFSAITGSIGFTLVFIFISGSVEKERAQAALYEIQTLSKSNMKPAKNISSLFYKLNILEKSSENFSREIAKAQLENGERIIKTFIGKKDVSFYKQDAYFLASWYSVTMTQSNLVLIELDSHQNSLNIARIPLSQVISADFEKGWLNEDKISLNFGADRVLNLDVQRSLRNQTQALCSVFKQGKANF